MNARAGAIVVRWPLVMFGRWLPHDVQPLRMMLADDALSLRRSRTTMADAGSAGRRWWSARWAAKRALVLRRRASRGACWLDALRDFTAAAGRDSD
ncbi:hypothetical protein F511_47602 [Dorcoceras hygrometricum]|uniref:Uncharacterized protein n=1 Tax=Dorcoceras hygrometricum TaxID=472368 RepID=A0A2Z6ZX15_9LAMI|nr:hypothetical protein F511_47602 [Dorcoceras hygrometricum]